MTPPLVFSFDQHHRAIIAVWDVLQGGVPGAKALQPTVDFQDSLEFGVGVVQLGAKLAGVRSATVPPAHAFPLADGVPLQLQIASAHPARRTGVCVSVRYTPWTLLCELCGPTRPMLRGRKRTSPSWRSLVATPVQVGGVRLKKARRGLGLNFAFFPKTAAPAPSRPPLPRRQPRPGRYSPATWSLPVATRMGQRRRSAEQRTRRGMMRVTRKWPHTKMASAAEHSVSAPVQVGERRAKGQISRESIDCGNPHTTTCGAGPPGEPPAGMADLFDSTDIFSKEQPKPNAGILAQSGSFSRGARGGKPLSLKKASLSTEGATFDEEQGSAASGAAGQYQARASIHGDLMSMETEEKPAGEVQRKYAPEPAEESLEKELPVIEPIMYFVAFVVFMPWIAHVLGMDA